MMIKIVMMTTMKTIKTKIIMGIQTHNNRKVRRIKMKTILTSEKKF